MKGNSIKFKDDNLNECKGRILDKILVIDGDVVITKYLVIIPNSSIVLVKPNQIKKVL